jgi:hypothetical protein
MIEVVVPVFGSASAAHTVADGLATGRIPTAIVRQFESYPAGPKSILEVRASRATSGERVKTLVVDERHAGVVKDIVGMEVPVQMTEAPWTAAA